MLYRILFPLLLCASAQAAQIPVTGKLEPLPGPTICQQGETHRLDCVTGLFLKSTTLDLSRWEGQIVTLTGNEIGLFCLVWDVTAVTPANVTLDWSGNPVLGGSVTFTLCFQNNLAQGSYTLEASKTPGFFPINSQLGTILIGNPAFLIGSGAATPCGNTTVTVPNKPALVGEQVYVQALGTHNFQEYSNVVCLEILP